MDGLARLSLYSSSRFQELFVGFVHEPVFEYIRKRRLTAACTDLSDSAEPTGQIARSYGYGTAKTFSRAFKAFHGITPDEYRRSHCPTRSMRPARVWPNPTTPQMPLFQSEAPSAGERVWQCSVRLSMPELSPPVVLVAVFDTDPVKRYVACVRDSTTPRRITSMIRHLGDRQSMIEFVLRTTKVALWDQIFSEIPGNRVSLVYGPDLPRVRPVVLTSEAVGGTRWLATRVAGAEGQYVCWSLPFDAAAGASSRLVLTRDNSVGLDELFMEHLDRQSLP